MAINPSLPDVDQFLDHVVKSSDVQTVNAGTGRALVAPYGPGASAMEVEAFTGSRSPTEPHTTFTC